MQAYPQNTRQLSAMQSESLEWWTNGCSWTLMNLGPGRLWFNYSGSVAAVGDRESTELRANFSFTHTESVNRYMEMTFQAAEALTYSLITNQRLPNQPATISEAEADGTLFVRRNAAWVPLAGPALILRLADLWHDHRLIYRVVGGGEYIELLGNLQRFTGADILPGTPFLIGTLPEGFRPEMSIQYGTCHARTRTGAPRPATLVLQTNGNLSVFVAEPCTGLYISQIFNLTIA